MPWYTEGIRTIIDARERLLAPGGVLIPHKDKVWAGLADSPKGYDQHFERVQGPLRKWGLFSTVEYRLDETPRRSFSGALK